MNHHHDNDAVRAHYAALAATYDRGANKACIAAYEDLVSRALASARHVLELGAGARPASEVLHGAKKTWTDLSPEMLLAGRARGAMGNALVADGQRLPFPDAAFDAAVSINVLEHVPDPKKFIAEAARVLRPGATIVLVTPNGDLEWLLDLLETLRLKLPEGPHQFRTTQDVRALAAPHFHIAEHRPFLACPAGPASLVNIFDRALPFGLFQYLIGTRLSP